SGVRRNAILALPPDARSTESVLTSGVLRDKDPQVVLAALLALADMPRSNEAAKALAEAVSSWPAETEKTLISGATAAAATHDRGFLLPLAARKPGPPRGAPALTIAERVAEHYARGSPADTTGGLVFALEGAAPCVTEVVIAGLARG